MAAKLKLTSRTIPWSLLIKAFAAAASWLILPYRLFFVLVLGFYFIPFFEPRRLLLPFGLFLFFAALLPANVPSALLLAFIFFLILGIKDLILVDRTAAYEMLFFALFFLAALGFFSRFESPSGEFFPAAVGVVLIFVLLLKNFLGFSPEFSALPSRERFLVAGIAGLILSQWLFAVLFLPMNRFYQAALAFLGGTILAELLFTYVSKSLERRKILAYFSVFFTVVAVVLALNSWKV